MATGGLASFFGFCFAAMVIVEAFVFATYNLG